MSDSNPPNTSLPPAAKSKMALAGLVLGAFTDWFLIALVAAGIWQKVLPTEPWAYLAFGLGAPSAVAGMLKRLGIGNGSASATALLFAGGAKVGLSGLLKGSLLGLVVLLTVGCGATQYDATQDGIDNTSKGLSALNAGVILLCQRFPGERCDDAYKAYEVATQAVVAAYAANDAARATNEGWADASAAYLDALKKVDEVRRVVAQ